jgi:hypothetical protein
VLVGSSTEGGLPGAAGAGATGSAGAGIFYNPQGGFSGGAFAGGGATAYAGGANVGAPAQNSPGVLGASGGGGGGAFLTNAQSVSQLSGPFAVYSFNLGFGPFQLSAQLALGGNIWEASFNPPKAGWTLGASISKVTTNTVTTAGNCQ